MARPAKTLDIEQTLWESADALRGSMDASEYKNVVLGLIFLKYVTDAFNMRYAELDAATRDSGNDDYHTDDEDIRERILSDPDEYRSKNVFWVPEDARWDAIVAKGAQSDLGEAIDEAMLAIEKANSSLRGVLPITYNRAELDRARLKQVVDLIAKVGFDNMEEDRDILGRVYEYFLLQFDMQYGRAAGEFYTPRDVVELLVEMVEPFEGRVYDPCCGSAGMFNQSVKFAEAHGGSLRSISVYGQESNPTTWKLAKMNMALKGIEANLGDQWADTFANDLHKDLKADYVLSNPPYNISSWARDPNDVRWQYGTPPEGNSNYAWLQHILHHLAPGGTAGVVMANGSLTSEQGGEDGIRKSLLEADLVDCIVTLPDKLFYTTGIPVCLWLFSRARSGQQTQRQRTGEVLFIDAKRLGSMVSRTSREMTAGEITKIAGAYHSWREASPDEAYCDEIGFCRSVDIDTIAGNGHVLTPGRYVGLSSEVEDDAERNQRIATLLTEFSGLTSEGRELEERVRLHLEAAGYEW